jgi:excisionase family DNA binding protein
MMEMLLTVEQAATRLQVDPETIRVRLRRGSLRGLKAGKLWRVPESALMEGSPKTERDEWASAAERLRPLYAASIEANGELTAFATADSDVYDYAQERAGALVGA